MFIVSREAEFFLGGVGVIESCLHASRRRCPRGGHVGQTNSYCTACVRVIHSNMNFLGHLFSFHFFFSGGFFVHI